MEAATEGFAARAARSARSVSEEDDRSRKGDVDRPIRDLVADINALGRETVFTTSSCSGRVSLVAEQTKGKRVKGEAKWILMSHDPVAGHEVAEAVDSYLQGGGGGGGDCSRETLTLRFEPFILAVECASVEVAAEILKVGREAGFRESGIQIGKRITLSIRCSIRLELPVCRDGVLLVTREYLGVCCELCDEKFSENFARIERFHRLLKPKLSKLGCGRRQQRDEAGGAPVMAVSAPRRRAKAVKDALKARGWLDQGVRPQPAPGGDRILFPVTSSFRSSEANLQALGEGLEVVSLGGAPKSSPTRSQHEELRRRVGEMLPVDLAKDLLEDLPRRWERLGDAVLIPKQAMVREYWSRPEAIEAWAAVAEALRCGKVGRQREVRDNAVRESAAEVLWPSGADGWVDHRENGIIYSFDFTKCMFSSGNVTEKARIASFDCSGEVVVDMFAGIGYFTLPYLVKANAEHLYACEWNPEAVRALHRNLGVNGCEDRCTVLEGDCTKNAPVGVANRVNLGLIPDSSMAWEAAVRSLGPAGGWLHVHTNCGSEEVDETAESMRERVEELAVQSGRCGAIVDVRHIERVKSYAPRVLHIVVDLWVRTP
ncbi:tRNA wybutosine-synthesizing protein [Chloropicon roscoffensis]|uniref:tRNA wybutosine-synthesizing protein n=2 Tax=Chloropicon roscoffensis TaxID=1461544 RepID=A0AAX4P829_9CHLO